MTTLPAATRRDVPSESSPAYSAHHNAVYTDPRITDLNPSARYAGEYSTDNGQTWAPVPMPAGWDTVCGGHVQVEVASALIHGWDATADGTARVVREGEGSLVRWTLQP